MEHTPGPETKKHAAIPSTADRALIAAAPALLAACEAVYRIAKDADLPGPVHLSIAERNQLEAAIKAAKGE